MKNYFFTFFISFVFLLTSCQTLKKHLSAKRGPRLVWDRHPNRNGRLAGFRLYAGDKQKNSIKKLLLEINDPKATQIYISQIKNKLDPEKANYLYLIAYDNKNKESHPSNITCWGKKCKKEK